MYQLCLFREFDAFRKHWSYQVWAIQLCRALTESHQTYCINTKSWSAPKWELRCISKFLHFLYFQKPSGISRRIYQSYSYNDALEIWEKTACARQHSRELHLLRQIRVKDKTAYMCKGYAAQIQLSFFYASPQELQIITFHLIEHTISAQLANVELVLCWSFQRAWFQWIDTVFSFLAPH